MNEYGSRRHHGRSVGMNMNAQAGEFFNLESADMYLIRTDGFSCTREHVENRVEDLASIYATMILVWREPPKTIFC